jgi:hypothetical protein
MCCGLWTVSRQRLSAGPETKFELLLGLRIIK